MADSEKLRFCYVVEGKTDEDRLRKLGARYVLKTGGKLIQPDQLKLIVAVSKIRRICICTDPDPAGIKIRERIVQACGSDRCSSIRTSISDSFNGRKIGIAETSLDTLHKVIESFLTYDLSCNEIDTFTSEDMFNLKLIGPGSKVKRETIQKELGVFFPDAKDFLQGMRLLRIAPQEAERILSEHGDRD